MPTDPQITIFKVDPLDPTTVLALPILVPKMVSFMEEHFPEGDAVLLVRQVLARVTSGDPGVLLLGFWDPAQNRVCGHALATLEGTHQKRWVYCWQMSFDGPSHDTVLQAFDAIEDWGRQHEALSMSMTVSKHEKGWQKKYQFDTVRFVMSRPITRESV